MNPDKQIALRPTFSFMFSYLWLAGELILFIHLIQYLIPSAFTLVTSFFMLCFARFYYWMNFSPETGFQTVFIFGLIPLTIALHIYGEMPIYFVTLYSYVGALLISGFIRISFLRYKIDSSSVVRSLFGEQSYKIDKSRPVKMLQHSRGKLLNFGCILIPTTDLKTRNESLMHKILFSQQGNAEYSNYLRVDGIQNPNLVMVKLNNQNER